MTQISPWSSQRVLCARARQGGGSGAAGGLWRRPALVCGLGIPRREQESAAADCEPSGASGVRSRSGGLTALQMRDDAPRALLLPLPPLIASHRKHPVAKRRRICRPVLDTLLDLLIDALHPGRREAGATSQRDALAPTRRGRRQGRPLVVALCSKHACSVTLIALAHAKGRVPNTASRALGDWPSSAAPGLASPDSRSDRLPKSTCTFVCTSRPARRGGVCSRLLRPLPSCGSRDPEPEPLLRELPRLPCRLSGLAGGGSSTSSLSDQRPKPP